ncbi:MAG: PhnD/SsuA/transferrin family substrate-binding protein [Actinomycetota bacterium]|nr:PhnD/SsuA/transferrin family substrate-binding protein [Actinomycetota bacterium]
MNKRALWALVAVFALVLAACSPAEEVVDTTEAPVTTEAPAATTTEAPAETTTSEAMAAIGSEEHPINVLFVPSVSAEEIIAGGDILEATLEAATGLHFDVAVPTSYAATLEEMCASPDDTIGFIPAQAYVLGSTKCDIEVSLKSLRFGYTEYWSEFIVPRDSDIQSVEDLAGKTWAYPDGGSTSGFLVPSGIFATLGIEVGDTLEAGGHTATVQAIYDGSADFGTVFFSPPIDADRNVVWDDTPENADVPADLVDSCGLNADGALFCGDNYEVRDARRNIREGAPDVIQKVRIVTLSAPIPNDTLSYGPEVSDEIKTAINDALKAFAADDPEGFEAAFDAYSWSGVEDTNDSEFDSIRALLDALGFTEDQLD